MHKDEIAPVNYQVQAGCISAQRDHSFAYYIDHLCVSRERSFSKLKLIKKLSGFVHESGYSEQLGHFINRT